jgi:hypothetical protein
MRVAIPVTDLSADGRQVVAATLNATGYMCLYDLETDSCQWLSVSELAPNLGELLPALGHRSVTDIISVNMQPMALKVLVNKGFKVFKSSGNNLYENIRLHTAHHLTCFDMEQLLAETNLCSGACGDCDTTCETATDDGNTLTL